MTIKEFAKLVDSTPLINDRGRGICPVHGSRKRSLSISLGRNGNVLLHCFAGCTFDSILAAFGLQKRDLFADSKPLTEEQWRQLNRKKLVHKAWADAYRDVSRIYFDRERDLWEAVRFVGEKLAGLPDGDPSETLITAEFHWCLEAAREAERQSVALIERGIPKYEELKSGGVLRAAA